MTNHRDRKRVKKPRVPLTKKSREHLFEIHESRSVPVLVKRTGLPYMLVYNVVHGRVRSISDRNFRKLFGQIPPAREPKVVDGATFRALVDLWLYLNDDVTKSDLYREFYGRDHPKKPDLRIFSGHTRSVPFRLERMMRMKFADAGIEGKCLEQWLDEMDELPLDNRVSYHKIRPILRFIQHTLRVHPSFVLNQSVERYETGMLKSVSRHIYDKAVTLKRRIEEAAATGQKQNIEKLKEAFTGGKNGYTLYSEVEDDLHFLRNYAKRGAKRYLGRGTWTYENGRAKRIANWRAQQIRQDCDQFIRETPNLQLSGLPRGRQAQAVRALIDVLVARAAQLLSEQEGLVIEKRILRPSHAWDEYKKPNHGFTRFDMASTVLGMRKKAFDLMVAKNCEIFRSVGRYGKRWYVSDLYLKELSGNAFFDLISAKYELMAKTLSQLNENDQCMH